MPILVLLREIIDYQRKHAFEQITPQHNEKSFDRDVREAHKMTIYCAVLWFSLLWLLLFGELQRLFDGVLLFYLRPFSKGVLNMGLSVKDFWGLNIFILTSIFYIF